jgi:hypothetical protein
MATSVTEQLVEVAAVVPIAQAVHSAVVEVAAGQTTVERVVVP